MKAAATAFPELADFVRAVENAYGHRLAGVFLYGSRARGEHRADSDYDVGVVLDDEGVILWQEVNRLADLALDSLLSRGIEIQAVPFSASEWRGQAPARELAREARRDAVPLVMVS